jgi:hypothetical protein
LQNQAPESGPGPQEPDTPDLATPNQDLRIDCQAHEYQRGQKQQTRRPNQAIQIDAEGKLIGRDRVPVPATDVFKLSAMGCKDHEIAEWFGVDQNTLRYNFSVELIKGRETLKQSLRKKQIEVAMQGNAVMLIWLGKNLLGQSDNPTNSVDQEPLPWADEE